MTAVLETSGLGKQYGRRWALSDCTLTIPAGQVVGLVGPNGAGKSTLLNMAVGLLAPTSGTIEVLGAKPADGPTQLGRVGFVAQDTPTYAGLSVADHLHLGAWLNPRWDRDAAEQRIKRLGFGPKQKAQRLSGGQRAQLALTLAIAKRPELLVLDEPVASLDPLARREFLRGLMEVVAEHGVSVVLSSHLVADLERVCDYLVVLVSSRVEAYNTRSSATTEYLASSTRIPVRPRGLSEVGLMTGPPADERRANDACWPGSVAYVLPPSCVLRPGSSSENDTCCPRRGQRTDEDDKVPPQKPEHPVDPLAIQDPLAVGDGLSGQLGPVADDGRAAPERCAGAGVLAGGGSWPRSCIRGRKLATSGFWRCRNAWALLVGGSG